MASLSVEEENYVRMNLLVTGISPRAIRNFFDSEFAPACLGKTMRQEIKTLQDLRNKKILKDFQWKKLFPRFPEVADSKNFDVTLMTLLLRNLTTIPSPPDGFDILPPASEITKAADLTRIKHYRNYVAHLDDSIMDTASFNTAWTDISAAIDRLGGQQLKEECDRLKTKPLDQTYQEVMIEVKRSNDEIKQLTKSQKGLKRSNIHMRKSQDLLQKKLSKVRKSNGILQINHKKIKTSAAILQDDHAHMSKEMEKMKTLQEDTVPWNVRESIKEILKTWKGNDDKMFIKTRAAELVLKCIQENSCVTITASSGVGKTATLRHVALQMVQEGYDVLMVTEPSDIKKYNNPNKRTLFVLDDLCGNFSVDQSDIKRWDPIMENIKTILEKNQTKILAACRLQVYQDEKFKSLSVFKSCICNLLSDDVCLTKSEKQSLAELYLKSKASEITDYYDLYDCFPLLCKLYYNDPKLNIADFFQNPFSVYESEVDQFFEKGHHTKYCALALCVIFNNKLKEDIFTEEVNEETRTIIANTCEACRLDRGTPRLVIMDELDSLTHTFIKKEQDVYKILHDKIFDFLAKMYGQKILNCLIRNADSGLIKERFLLERKDDMDQFITVLPQKYHQMYIKRMIDDWSKRKLQDVFGNINMKIPQFREKFLCYLNTLDIPYQRQLAHICADNDDNDDVYTDKANDDVVYNSALLHCCDIGDISFVQWCCYHGVNVNMSTYNGQLPMIIAAEHGHAEIVKMLVDRGAYYDICNSDGKSPVMMACEHGHTEIVEMLLDKGVDCNTGDRWGWTHIMKACNNGHTAIVKMLLDKEAEYDKSERYSQSNVMRACEDGYTEIVKMLLDRGVDYNRGDRWGVSPLMKACQHGHSEIVKLLLDRGVEFDKCDQFEESALMNAFEYGYPEIVKTLLIRGADHNRCDRYGESPVMKACQHGHTEIVKMLLDRGVHLNECDRFGESPLMTAFENGYTEIVKMLLDEGADCNTCDRYGRSIVMKACARGNTEIVKILLDKGADYDTCQDDGESPVDKLNTDTRIEILYARCAFRKS